MKKLISILTAMALILGCLPVLAEDAGGVTRAEFALGLAEYVIEVEKGEPEAHYSDVAEDSPYYEAIASLAETGIVDDTHTDRFNPDDYITAMEACEMALRLCVEQDLADSVVKDRGVLNFCREQGLLEGLGDIDGDEILTEEMCGVLLENVDSLSKSIWCQENGMHLNSQGVFVMPLTYEEKVQELIGYGIIAEEAYSSLDLTSSITRAEFCSLAAGLLGPYTATQSGEPLFSDISSDHWAYDSISEMRKREYISGGENGEFRPDEYITYGDILVILIRMLGYEPKAELMGGYPDGYTSVAREINLANVSSALADEASWGDALLLLYNALDIPWLVAAYHFKTDDGQDKIDYIMLNGVNGAPLQTYRTMLEWYYVEEE